MSERQRANNHHGTSLTMNVLSRLGRLPALDLAERAAAHGTDVVPMPGAPVIPMPDHVVEAARAAAAEAMGRETRGEPTLRHALAAMLHERQGVDVDPDRELLVTHGASHAISVVLGALLSPGDQVLVPTPTYFFDGPIVRGGGEPLHVSSDATSGWAWDFDAIAAAITSQVRVILVCNPVNPTGRLHTADEIDELVALARCHDLTIVADESFSDYVFEGVHIPFSSRRPDHDRIISIQSLSKNYAFASWRIGYVQAAASLLNRIHACFEWDAINVGPVPQAAATAALTGDRRWLDQHLEGYRAKRDLLVRLVRAAGFDTVVPEAGASLLADFSALGLQGRRLEDHLLAHGVAAIAGDAFRGPPASARLLFGGTPSQLQELGRRLANLGAAPSSTGLPVGIVEEGQ